MRKFLFVLLILMMTGCSLLPQDDPAFIPPSDFETTATLVEIRPRRTRPWPKTPL